MSEAICVAGSLFGELFCVSCYLISMWSVVAIIAIDIILTVLICHFVTAKRDMTEITESPYQELHGVQSDVYSELHHFRKETTEL
uniref:TYRO protein tyrosine kinase-binding protein n=1 Tax=Cynoglossus semilaevis TaxID=244447 RepID=A0A3P8VH27_CYNSE